MEEEELIDYARGLKAPYWIQEIKSMKGQRIWYFSTPVQFSFFVVFGFVAGLIYFSIGSWIDFLGSFTGNFTYVIYWFLPYKVAKWFSESEPQGKKPQTFVMDALKYLYEYRLNKKAIYQGERVDREKKFVFEKTHL